jgi:hypothetical protein
VFFWYWYSRRSKNRLSIDFSGVIFGRGGYIVVYDTSSSLVVDIRYYFNAICSNRRLIHVQECRFVLTRPLTQMNTNRSQKPSVRLKGFVEWWLYEDGIFDIQVIRKKTVSFSFFSPFMLYYFSIFYFFRSISPITLSSSLLSILYSSTIISVNFILLLSHLIYIIILQLLYPFLPLLTRRRVRLGLESTEEVVNCRSINNTAHFSICDWLLYAWHLHHRRMLLREVTQNILFLWKKSYRILCGQQIDVRACLL